MSLVFGDVEITNNISGVGLSSRRPARVATTGTVTLSSGFANGQVIDNITLVTGDRILIKNQSNPIENGVYEVQASGPPIRTPDYSDGDAVSGSSIFIQEGIVNNGTEWLCISLIGTDIVNTNPLLFKLTSGDVSGQGLSTDNAIVRWDGTTGTKIQNSAILVDDSNNMTGLQYTQFSDITAPTNPLDGQGRLYKKTGDDGFYWLPDSAGVEVDLTNKTIIIQDEGSNILGTPHTTLNFVGPRITAADAGSAVANITVNMPVTTKGDIFTYSTTDARLPVGTNGQILTVDSAQTTGLKWSTSLTPIQLPNTIISDTISANQNDYNPTGFSTGNVVQIRITPSGTTRTIYGLALNGSTALAPLYGELKITNVGTQHNVILQSDYTDVNNTSVNANKFLFDKQNVVIIPGQSFTLFYDYISERWRGVASSQDGSMGGTMVTSGVISPPALSVAVNNNYAPTGIENATILRLTSTVVTSLTGLAGGVPTSIAPLDGRIVYLVNIGSNPITLINLSSLSTSFNRFYTGSTNATLVGNATIVLIYDGTSGFWRVSGGTAGSVNGTGGLVQSQWSEVTIDQSTISGTWPVYFNTINSAITLPTGTITVVSTGATSPSPTPPGCPTSNTASITNPQFLIVYSTINDNQIVTYTGNTGTTFTGCVGGSGAVAVGNYVWNGPQATYITAGSNSVSLPTGTINVVDTTGFSTSGILLVTTTNGTQRVLYTGTTATTFTGCTGGAGVMSTGGVIYNVSTTSQDLLTINITTSGGALIINFAASASTASNRTGYFQIVVDGFVRRGASTQGNGGAPSGSAVIGLKIPILAGNHVITARWIVSGGTLAVFPVTKVFDNNASLLVQEVAS